MSHPQRESWKESEGELFRLLVENVKDYAIFVIDPKGRVESWNPGAERLLGFREEEMIGQSIAVFFTPEDIEKGYPQREFQQALTEGRGNDDRWHVRKDGSRFWCGGTLTPLWDDDRNLRGFAKIMRDLTEWKRNQDATEEQVFLAAFIKDVGLALTRSDDLPEMLHHCSEAMVRHLHGGFARIWTLNSDESVLVLRASAGLYTHLDGPHSRVPVGKYKIGLIARERLPHLTNAVESDPRVSDQEWAKREGMVAFAGYPLVVEDRLVGVMAMFARHPLTDATLEAMSSVANGIALGIERKTAEEGRRQQQEWWRVTLASIGDAVIATDTQGRVTFLNSVAQEMTGWPSADAEGQSLEAVFPIVNEQTRQPVQNPVEKVLREGVIVGLANHTILVARDGTERPIDDSAAPIRDGSGRMIGVVLVFRDVTEQRRAEQELRASEARKSAILHTALDCIITMDHDGNVVEFNPAAERTFGYSRDQVIGRELSLFIIPPALRDRHRTGMAHYLATGEGPVLGRRLELPALRADGTEFPAELAITRIPTDGPPLFTAYLRDVSEYKRTEQHRTVRIAVTHALGEAAGPKEGAADLLRAVCDNLGWDLGFYWTVEENGTALHCVQAWRRPDVAVAGFEADSFARTFKQGEGLPGSVWSTGKPRWLPDVAKEPQFPRAASAANYDLHSAFACPVTVGDRTLGVIEFFTRRTHEPDADLLETMGTVAGNFGQFLERKAAEERVRRSERELADFFENATVGLHWVGADGTILRANRAELELLGYSREEYVGRPVADFHADESTICDILTRLQAGEELHEYPARLKCKDGTIKDVLIDSSVLFRDGGFVHTRCFTRDVTERKRAEDALRQSEQKALFLADASAALASVVDYESTLQKVANLAAPHFADWSAVDVANDDGTLRRLAVAHQDAEKIRLAHELMTEYPPDPEAPGGAFAVLRTGQPEIVAEITDDMLLQGARDERHLTLIRSLGLRSYICVPLVVSGNPLGVLTFATAESGRRYTDADLALAVDLAQRAGVAIENTQLYQALRDADRRKDEFLATLAHELRNPLAPIRNALQILKMPRVDAATVERSREMMERQVHHLVRLVDDLLDVSRVMRGKIELRRERVELATVVARAVETVQPLVDTQGHQLSLGISSESLLLDGDPVRLAQVVGNLLTNAAKYTEANGRIRLTAEREGNEAVLRIRDDGIGIAPNMLPRIFELFVQVDHASTKAQGGLGIGLTLVKNLVQMHNGSVEARSAGLGQGSEFVVRLPIPVQGVEQVHDRGTGQQEQQAPTPSGHRLLIVDDNQDAANSLAMLLKLQGHEVRVAHNGPAALEITKGYTPDVVFLDIGMPGMDGYEVARRMRQQPGLENVVLAALTGWGQKEDRRRTAEAGFNHHLVKPPEPKAVEGVLAELKRPEAR